MKRIKQKIVEAFLSIFCILLVLAVPAVAQEEYVAGTVVVEFQTGVVSLPEGEYIFPIDESTILNPQVLSALQSIDAYEAEKLFKKAVPGQTEIFSPIVGQMVQIKDLSQYFIIRFDEEEPVENAISILSSLSEVISAAPDFYPVNDGQPNDPYFSLQYHLENSVNSYENYFFIFPLYSLL